jgi:hypothetical protein
MTIYDGFAEYLERYRDTKEVTDVLEGRTSFRKSVENFYGIFTEERHTSLFPGGAEIRDFNVFEENPGIKGKVPGRLIDVLNCPNLIYLMDPCNKKYNYQETRGGNAISEFPGFDYSLLVYDSVRADCLKHIKRRRASRIAGSTLLGLSGAVWLTGMSGVSPSVLGISPLLYMVGFFGSIFTSGIGAVSLTDTPNIHRPYRKRYPSLDHYVTLHESALHADDFVKRTS